MMMMMMTGGTGGGEETGERSVKTIKLLCPALSNSVVVSWMIESEEQKLDLGAIARTFGLDPSTLKLNGHFISRGVDLIAYSVTWKSLLSFFSARGLSTGAHDTDAVIVNGKLCKPGAKRAHDPVDAHNDIYTELEDASSSENPQLEDNSVLKKRKLQEGYSGYHGVGLKRKQWFEDVSQLKRLRINESQTDFIESQDDISGAIVKAQIPCSYSSKNTKQIREDEMVMATPCKKT